MSDEKNPMADTAELPTLERTPSASAGVGRVRVDFGGASNPGLVRPNNEDHFLACRFGRYLTPIISNLPGPSVTLFEEEGHGLAVADGMGGAAAGELASNLAIRTLLNLIVQTPDWIISTAPTDVERVMQRMIDRYRLIDEKLLDAAAKNKRLRGMGTTMTVAANVGDCLVLTHIGDSRAYLFRKNVLYQLTRDHTVAQALVDQGILTKPTDAATQLQHTLVRVLGGMGHQCEADVQRMTLFHDDVVLLCSDGLTDMVNDADIAKVLATGLPAAEACQGLIERALENGGKDNVTVVIARYAFVDRPEA